MVFLSNKNNKGAKTEQNGNTTTKERADKINNQQSQKK